MSEEPAALEERLTKLEEFYRHLACGSRMAASNTLRDTLPLRLRCPGDFEFVPASSLSLQSLVPRANALHEACVDLVACYAREFASVAERSFWQPAGTFHLNVAIIRRLSVAPLTHQERHELLAKARPALRWLRYCPRYALRFQGVLIRSDGTIMVKGYPRSLTPWRIRDEFIRWTFADQQPMFHLTLGRILQVLPPTAWSELVDFTENDLANRDLGTYVVGEANLVNEREGFLHSPSAYHIVERFQFL